MTCSTSHTRQRHIVMHHHLLVAREPHIELNNIRSRGNSISKGCNSVLGKTLTTGSTVGNGFAQCSSLSKLRVLLVSDGEIPQSSVQAIQHKGYNGCNYPGLIFNDQLANPLNKRRIHGSFM